MMFLTTAGNQTAREIECGMRVELLSIRGVDRIEPKTGPSLRYLQLKAFFNEVFQGTLRFFLIGLLSLASYLFISHFVLQSVEVVGSSMVPTLHNSDHYFVNRWSYYLNTPQRGDVVVIKDPTDGKYSVKRIVAIEGESLFFKDGTVYVNGKPLDEPYLGSGTRTFPGEKARELITCGRNQFYVLGDNRENSFDSRIYGAIPRENILGAIIR